MLIAAYAPRVISFAAGQAAFTVVLVLLFNIIQPTGWKVGLIRIEDVAIGFAVSLGVGLVFSPAARPLCSGRTWPPRTRAPSDYVAIMVEQLTGRTRGDAARAEQAATTAVHRLDDSFRQYLAERSAQRVNPERVSRMVGGVAKVLAGQSLAALNALADGPPVLGQSPPGPPGGQDADPPPGPGCRSPPRAPRPTGPASPAPRTWSRTCWPCGPGT